MPIRFTCPHCGATTDVSDEYAGRSGPCAGCGQTITVPLPGAVAGYAAPPTRSPTPIVLAVVGVVVVGFLVCGGGLVALFVFSMRSSVEAARGAARRAQCSNHLKQIALAMVNYESTYRCFPPAYTTDENGKPMHSWRVLILPFLEQRALYDRYRLDEPWNSPHNRALADLMPRVYRCPSDTTGSPYQTSYAVIVGPKAQPGRSTTLFAGDQPAKYLDATDGLSNTLMVVEAAGAGIHWMEPRDLELEDMDFKINTGSGRGIQSNHDSGAQVAFATAP